MTQPPSPIETERLVLRRPILGDAEAMLSGWCRDQAICRYMCWTVHHDVDETRGVIRSFLEGWERGEHFNFMLELKDGGKLIGCVSIAPTAHSHEMLMGWLVAREYWGVGYAAEAIRPLVTWGLSLPEVYRVSAICDVDNPASARAAEKAGMQREAILRRFAIHPNVSLAPRDVIVMAAVK